MTTTVKRSTIYLDSGIHKALRLKAAETDRSLSDLVNEAVKTSLAEDADDLAAFRSRESEPNLLFEKVVTDMRRRGKL
jgi:plasmid stability protein